METFIVDVNECSEIVTHSTKLTQRWPTFMVSEKRGIQDLPQGIAIAHIFEEDHIRPVFDGKLFSVEWKEALRDRLIFI